MADNVDVTPGTGKTFATDDIGGVQYPRAKMTWGPDGTANDTDVASGKPLPVQLRSATGLIPFGEPTDAKATQTDTTSVSAISIWKQISASVQSAVTALGSTALDLGQGTGGSRTLRVAIDSAQLDGSEYETVAASQTAQVLGATGATGDFLSGILVIPATTSPGNVLLLDNATSITVFTGGATSVSNLVPFFIPLGMFSVSGAWKLTTGANVSCIGIGNFT
jgi:hypothetical protein